MASSQATIVAFAATTDLDPARAFYQDALGLTVDEVVEFGHLPCGNSTMVWATKVPT